MNLLQVNMNVQKTGPYPKVGPDYSSLRKGKG